MKGRPEERFERMIGVVLRAGVVAAALVVFLGGIRYLDESAFTAPRYRVFEPHGAYARNLPGIVENARHLSGYGIIQLGLLLLIATPVIRVALSAVVFALQKDITYVVVTCIVLAVLAYGFTGHG